MVTQFHYLLVRQRQAELADRAERVRQIRDRGRLDASRRDRHLLERVITALLRRGAASSRAHAPYRRAPEMDAVGEADVAITLRLAGAADSTAVADLAGLDSASVPATPVLIAEAGREIRAALSLRDGAMIADPFHRTAAARQLLRARAEQLRGDRGRGWPRRLLGRAETATRTRPTNPSAAIGGAATNHHQ